MTNNWEVLLKRDNGFNRTVIIEDCMYESEAAEEAGCHGRRRQGEAVDAGVARLAPTCECADRRLDIE